MTFIRASNYEVIVVFCVAPGPVSNLGNKTKFTSIDIMWDAPQNPNGVILRYEIFYTVNDSVPVMFNNTISDTIFTIPRLTPGTRVFVSVSAYTSVGQGEAASLNMITLSEPRELLESILPGTSFM